jgi:hypothetical protein
VNPAHTLGSRLGTRHGQRRPRRIDADDVETAVGEEERERPRAASDVEDGASAELLGDGDVDVEIAAVRIERVVDRRQPRMLEGRVGHSAPRSQRGQAQYAVRYRFFAERALYVKMSAARPRATTSQPAPLTP